MFMKIEKKAWPDYFQKILEGTKSFDVRLADFNCEPGDILVLREWNPEKNEYTGRIIEKEITFVAKTKEMPYWSKEDIEKYGYQLIGLK